jgi:hypothetical protein
MAAGINMQAGKTACILIRIKGLTAIRYDAILQIKYNFNNYIIQT